MKFFAWRPGPDEEPVAIPHALSDGARTLQLIFNQPDWTHRRVETVSFPDTGETRRRVSWDFTVPAELALMVGDDRVAVPLATLAKAPLRRVDVTDANGSSVPVWGTDDNGELSVLALTSALSGLLRRDLLASEAVRVREIVFARDAAAAAPYLEEVRHLLSSTPDPYAAGAVTAVAEDLAANFLFVVELPLEVVGRRTLVKLTYERQLDDQSGSLLTAHRTVIKGGSWTTGSRSWHLEVHAPPGLAVSQLMYQTWDAEENLIDEGESDAQGHTGHITGQARGHETDVEATLSLLPAREGLVNQVLAGAVVATALLTVGAIWSGEVFDVTRQPDQAGSVAAVTLAVPAFLIAVLARSQEHPLVSRLLFAPRLNSVLTALVLLSSAAALVLGLTRGHLFWTTATLWVIQVALLIWAFSIRRASVGAAS